MKTTLYVFGNQLKPREPRIAGYNWQPKHPGQEADFQLDENGMVIPVDGSRGASLFAEIDAAPLSGHYHRLPPDVELPDGLAIRADGIDSGGSQPRTHYTMYPTRLMRPEVFIELYFRLPWEYGGQK